MMGGGGWEAGQPVSAMWAASRWGSRGGRGELVRAVAHQFRCRWFVTCQYVRVNNYFLRGEEMMGEQCGDGKCMAGRQHHM